LKHVREGEGCKIPDGISKRTRHLEDVATSKEKH
jgi:hypothetical protein